jgi:diaminohydroxyphosphoribosylaminopyrimidine deaminase / 5-amino-6-(5-phosphoribosylamino)uracil reductase
LCMDTFMLRALSLANRGIGNVAPNPLVGCVIVHDNKVIGEGWHEHFGGPHAEVNAINSIKDKTLLSTSTLYVTLEPCSHTGKTPPCADLIIKMKIPKVVIATTDPNPLVSGQGIKRLRENGIEVVYGILESRARFQNRRFFVFHEKKRPYIILKWAQSKDGFIDAVRENGQKGSIPISGQMAHQLVHQWRAEEAAILVGKNTGLIDNPSLTVRLWQGKNPVRILIDPMLEVPGDSKIYNDEVRTIVFNRLETRNIFHVDRIQLDFSEPILPKILEYLHYEGLQSVLVEGGAETIKRFLDANIWDEIRRFTSKTELGNGLKGPKLELQSQVKQAIADDSLEIFYKFTA